MKKAHCLHLDVKKKGFTLIELLVVVAIIGILAAVGVVAYNGYTKAAKKAVTKKQFYTYVNLIKSTLAECYLGNDYVKLMNKRPVRQIPDKKYYNFDCKLPSDSLTSSIMTHIRNLDWVNPYAANSGAGRKSKTGWGWGHVFSEGPKGAIVYWVKKNPATGRNNIIYVETKYDDSNEPRWCKKNCVTLSEEIIDNRKF